jgi:hypothetical protein
VTSLTGIALSSDFSKIRIGIQITVDCSSRIFRCLELAPSAFVFRYRALPQELSTSLSVSPAQLPECYRAPFPMVSGMDFIQALQALHSTRKNGDGGIR